MKPILALLIFLVGVAANATDYYVDYATGSDSNNGTSNATPWKHCPGDPAATSTAASATLSAGGTVYFKGGISYVCTGATGIVVNSSGSSGNPITYDGNSGGTWGTGKATITDNYGANGISGISSATSRSYITIKNIIFTHIGGSATLPTDTGSPVSPRTGSGVVFSNGSIGLVVDGCNFDGLGYYWNSKPMSNSNPGHGDTIDGNGFYLVNPSSFAISNCDITNCHTGLGTYFTNGNSSTGGTVTNVTVHDAVAWAFDLAPQGNNTPIPPILYEDCTIYDTYPFDYPFWTGYGTDAPHTDGYFFRNDNNSGTWSTTTVNRSLCYTTGNGGGGSGYISITEGPNVDIINSHFIYAQKSRGIFINNSGTTTNHETIRILNNSFLCKYNQVIGIQQTSALTNCDLIVENNVFQDTETTTGNNFMLYMNLSSAPTNAVFDYNIWRSLNTSSGGSSTGVSPFFHGGTDGREFASKIGFSGPGEGGLVDFMQFFGWETHGQNADPKYVTVPTNSSPLSGNLHLQVSSPARGAGINLTSLGIAKLNVDRAGVARPTVGAWDLGSFQDSSGGGGDTTAPTPNPSTIASTSVLGSTSYSVTATTATDAGSPPVQYRFSKDGGSTWTAYQSSATYTFTGLTASTGYSTKVQAEDSAGTPNVTTASSSTTVTTDAASGGGTGIPALLKASGKKTSPNNLSGFLQ